jgi:hypothetical protein
MTIKIWDWIERRIICNVSGTVDMLQSAWLGMGNNEASLETILETVSEATACERCGGDGSGGDSGCECEDCGGSGALGEVYEYWAIDTWLGNVLQERGEGVFNADLIGIAGGMVWCRTTTGQSIASDAVIEAIFKDYIEGNDG